MPSVHPERWCMLFSLFLWYLWLLVLVLWGGRLLSCLPFLRPGLLLYGFSSWLFHWWFSHRPSRHCLRVWCPFHWSIFLSRPFLCRVLLFLLLHTLAVSLLTDGLFLSWFLVFFLFLGWLLWGFRLEFYPVLGSSSSAAFLWLYWIPYYLFRSHFLLLVCGFWVLLVQLLLFPWSTHCTPLFLLSLGIGLRSSRLRVLCFLWVCYSSPFFIYGIVFKADTSLGSFSGLPYDVGVYLCSFRQVL